MRAHEQIDLSLHHDDVDLEATFTARAPLFNFTEYDHANPDAVSLSEIMQFATNQQSVHQQQAMHVTGRVTVKAGERAGHRAEIDGPGYRDHSRMVRCDNMVRNHFWNGLHFPNRVFGAMYLVGLLRPQSPAGCGYVWDVEHGLRPLRQVEVVGSGDGPEGVPATVELRLTDIYDRPYTIVADLTNRYAHVPLHTESLGAAPYIYDVVESFAPLQLKETGETGIGLVEVGWSTPATPAGDRAAAR